MSRFPFKSILALSCCGVLFAACSPVEKSLSCDSPEVQATVRNLIAGVDTEGLSGSDAKSAWLSKVLKITVLNQKQDDTGRHLSCAAQLDIADEVGKEASGLIGLAVAMGKAEGAPVSRFVFHYIVTKDASSDATTVVVSPDQEEEQNRIALARMTLQSALKSHLDASEQQSQSQGARETKVSNEQIPPVKSFAHELCGPMDRLTVSDSFRQSGIAAVGVGYWKDWAVNGTSCHQIETVTDPDLGDLTVLPKQLLSNENLNATIFVQSDQKVLAGCFSEDGKTSEWVGSGWSVIEPLNNLIAESQLWQIHPQFWVGDPATVCVDGVPIVLERVENGQYRFSEANAQCTAPASILKVAVKMLDFAGLGSRSEVTNWIR